MKIASIEKIHSVVPHPNADRLDLVKILGYQVVSQKNLHNVGDLVVYVQPDSILPENQEWADKYRKYAPSRIRCIRLRGVFSEGLIISMEEFIDIINKQS